MTADELWTSSVPRFGVVRTVIVDGEYAATFDDLNGDGREIELNVYRRVGDRWEGVAHQDDVAVPEVGGPPLVGVSGWDAHAVGRGRPGQRWQLEWIDERRFVQADQDGWWIVVVDHDFVGTRFPEIRLWPAE